MSDQQAVLRLKQPLTYMDNRAAATAFLRKYLDLGLLNRNRITTESKIKAGLL